MKCVNMSLRRSDIYNNIRRYVLWYRLQTKCVSLISSRNHSPNFHEQELKFSVRSEFSEWSCEVAITSAP